MSRNRYKDRREQLRAQWSSYQTLYLPEQVDRICRDTIEDLYEEFGELHDEPPLRFGALFIG